MVVTKVGLPAPPPPMLYSPIKSRGLVFKGLSGVPIWVPIVFAVGFTALECVAHHATSSTFGALQESFVLMGLGS